jgi:hypothetical protein
MKGQIPTRPEDATLLEVLADGFEKNETLSSWFWRQLPLPDVASASRKYDELHAELLRWKGSAAERNARSSGAARRGPTCAFTRRAAAS